MMRNVNQVCGVLALIGVGCLVAFGSAGDRIVSAAPGQIAPAGDTGTALAIGGCNRCAWSYKNLNQMNVPPGTEVVIFPRGTSGVIRWGYLDSPSGGPSLVANCFESGSPGEISAAAIANGYTNEGVRFVDGVIARFNGPVGPYNIIGWLYYRLD